MRFSQFKINTATKGVFEKLSNMPQTLSPKVWNSLALKYQIFSKKAKLLCEILNILKEIFMHYLKRRIKLKKLTSKISNICEG